jgi:hypothetical protein
MTLKEKTTAVLLFVAVAALAEQVLDGLVAAFGDLDVELSDRVADLGTADGHALAFAFAGGLVTRATVEEDLLEIGSGHVAAHRATGVVGTAGDLDLVAVETDRTTVDFVPDGLAEESVRVLSVYVALIRRPGFGIRNDDLKVCHTVENWVVR